MVSGYSYLALLWTVIVSISIVTCRPRVTLFDVADDDSEHPDQSISTVKSLFSSCDPCPVGWGVKSLCTTTSNTVCTPCPSGFWSPKRPHFRPCSPCSKCGDGLYEDIPCTRTRDTQCDACSNVKGHFNEDYKRKCDWRRAPESLKEADDETGVIMGEDEDDDYQDDITTSNPIMMRVISDRLKKWRLNAGDKQQKEGDITFDEPKINNDGDQSMHNEPHKIDTDLLDSIDAHKIDLDHHEMMDHSDRMDDQNIDESEEIEDDGRVTGARIIQVWSRILALRRKAQQSVADLSDRLDKKSLEAVDDIDDDAEDYEDDQKDSKRAPIAHMMRPLPQMVPSPFGVVSKSDSQSMEETWEEEDPADIAKENRLEVNYPPSYHSYPVEELMHRQRRKAIVVITITCFLIVIGIALILCLAYRRRRAAVYDRVMVVNLSAEEREIVRKSATQLAKVDKPVKRYHLGKNGGYTSLVDAESQENLAIRENPLEAYLNGEDVQVRHDESKKVHKKVQRDV